MANRRRSSDEFRHGFKPQSRAARSEAGAVEPFVAQWAPFKTIAASFVAWAG